MVAGALESLRRLLGGCFLQGGTVGQDREQRSRCQQGSHAISKQRVPSESTDSQHGGTGGGDVRSEGSNGRGAALEAIVDTLELSGCASIFLSHMVSNVGLLAAI